MNCISRSEKAAFWNLSEYFPQSVEQPIGDGQEKPHTAFNILSEKILQLVCLLPDEGSLPHMSQEDTSKFGEAPA